jgi:hypothetical protein
VRLERGCGEVRQHEGETGEAEGEEEMISEPFHRGPAFFERPAVPYNDLPEKVRQMLVHFWMWGVPKARVPRSHVNEWMGEQFFKTLDDNHINHWLKAAAGRPEQYGSD